MSIRRLILFPVMKRNLPGCSSLAFMVIFTCTFSFRQVAAAGNLSRSPLDIFKSFEKRAHDCIPEDTILFENEGEDETEDETAADSFIMVSCQTGGTSLFEPITARGNTFLFSAPSFNSAIRNPLYLVMRSFRI